MLAGTILAAAYTGYVQTSYAKDPAVPICSTDPFCFTVPEQGDEGKMDIDVAHSTATQGPFYGSVHGNGAPQFTPDITITTDQGVTTGSGYANIKDSDNSAWTEIMFVVNPTAINAKTQTVVHTFLDGFYTHVQLEPFQAVGAAPAPAPAANTAGFTMVVNRGMADEASFDFTGLKWNADIGPFGFDEPMLLSNHKLVDNDALAMLVHTVELVTDDGSAFFQVKQTDWSFCQQQAACGDNPVINPTGGGAPEASTWAMGLIGFGVLGALAFKRRRDARFALEA